MDIITHTFSGLLFGTVAASFLTEKGWKKSGIITLGGIGGCLPDIDTISLWSGFDTTIGKLFNLSLYGHEIYFSKLWYSHHGFFHSIAAICCYIILFCGIKYILNPFAYFESKNDFLPIVAFSGGYFIHIMEDLPTPGGNWGGVNIFWPSGHWSGGTGQIWWWNNYDLFLIVSTGFVLNVIILVIKSNYKYSIYVTVSIFLLSVSLVGHQISTRPLNFNQSGLQSRELKSLDIQRKILGNYLYELMIKIDDRVKLNF